AGVTPAGRSSALRTRMGAVVHAAQTFRVHVAVHLRGRQRAVAEQLLNRSQVSATLEQVSRERVTETVGMREDASHRGGVESPTARRDEQRVLGAAGQRRSRVLQVARDAKRRLLPERDDPLLIALATDP